MANEERGGRMERGGRETCSGRAEAFALHTEGLTVGYDGRPLIRDVNLQVRRGEVLTLIGPNGAGKSTILKSITRQLEPLCGVVCVDGRPLGDLSALEAARHVSVLLTGHMRTDMLTCCDVVEAGRYPYTGRLGVLGEADRRAVRDAMELVDVWDLRDRDFMRISDGQRQRVLLARAIAQEPDVVVLDEPTSYLDVRYQVEFARILRALVDERNVAVVMSMHELDLAQKLSDTVACVRGDRIARVGEPRQVFTREVIEELYDLEPGSYDPLFGISVEPRRADRFETAGGKRLRCGYTTGTCAAAAARGAAELLLLGDVPPAVAVTMPDGTEAVLELEDQRVGDGWASCAVRKDAGDDPDVTDGMLVAVRVERSDEPGVTIDGGEGVGRVTLPGLDQPVGAAAINSVPRAMIAQQVEAVLAGARVEAASRDAARVGAPSTRAAGSRAAVDVSRETSTPAGVRGLAVTVSIPGGEEVAAKTFNPRLGIQGGLSVLGTSGIVKPMSEEALRATIRAELSLRRAAGHRHAVVAPGNYGLDFACRQLGVDEARIVQCSNFIGATIDMASELGFESLLLIGHVGKLAKAAAGAMNTHSRVADGRREVLAAHAACCGAPASVVRAIMDGATTDVMLDELARAGVLEPVMRAVVDELGGHLRRRAGQGLSVEAIMFSKTRGLLGMTSGAEGLAAHHRVSQSTTGARDGQSGLRGRIDREDREGRRERDGQSARSGQDGRREQDGRGGQSRQGGQSGRKEREERA